MSVISKVIEVVSDTIQNKGVDVPAIDEDTPLEELRLDSLDWALIVAALELEFSYDPFLEEGVSSLPQTIRDLARYYEGR